MYSRGILSYSKFSYFTAFDTTTTVLSTAATAGIVIAVLLFLAVVIGGVLICYYYKKRKEKEARDNLPLQKSQPANKRLTNGHLFKDSKIRDSKTTLQTPNATPLKPQNGDVKINMDDIIGIRREDSICLSMTSRGPSILPGQSETESRNGPAPVEEPEKVRDLFNNTIEESDHETTLASTFLPISPAEKQLLNFSPRDIAEKEARNKEEKEDIDMDDIDDELGLPRLSRAAFTPVTTPEPATLPTLIYKKLENESETEDERTADGIKKVKLKKRKKKIRVTSAKGNVKGAKPKSATKQKTAKGKEFPFLERIKKQDSESIQMEVQPRLESQQSTAPRLESQQSAAKLIGTKSPEKAPENTAKSNEVTRARVREGQGTPAGSKTSKR